jgi:protein-S-isoprenylcysteine O-methyltransferase Ste14
VLLLPLLPAALIWPWQASVVLGLLASGLLFVLLRHDATRVRLPSWGSDVQMAGGLLAAVVLVTGWLWGIHILVRSVNPQ